MRMFAHKRCGRLDRQKSEVGLMKYHACRRHARCQHPCGNLGIPPAQRQLRKDCTRRSQRQLRESADRSRARRGRGDELRSKVKRPSFWKKRHFVVLITLPVPRWIEKSWRRAQLTLREK